MFAFTIPLLLAFFDLFELLFLPLLANCFFVIFLLLLLCVCFFLLLFLFVFTFILFFNTFLHAIRHSRFHPALTSSLYSANHLHLRGDVDPLGQPQPQPEPALSTTLRGQPWLMHGASPWAQTALLVPISKCAGDPRARARVSFAGLTIPRTGTLCT